MQNTGIFEEKGIEAKGLVARVKRITNQTNLNLNIYHCELKQAGGVYANNSADCDFGFPWVSSLNEFISRVIVIELGRKVRFYIWDSDSHLWNFRTYTPIEFQSPFDKNTRIKMDGKEWISGSLVDGEHSKDKDNKELVFKEKNGHVVLRVNNI